jgi:hypothetical protein
MKKSNAESVGASARIKLANAFSVAFTFYLPFPGLKQPWAEISQRFQRYLG